MTPDRTYLSAHEILEHDALAAVVPDDDPRLHVPGGAECLRVFFCMPVIEPLYVAEVLNSNQVHAEKRALALRGDAAIRDYALGLMEEPYRRVVQDLLDRSGPARFIDVAWAQQCVGMAILGAMRLVRD